MRLELLGKDLRWNPSTACGGPPPLSGEAFGGGKVLVSRWGLVWKVGTPPPPGGGPPPLEGRQLGWEGFGVEVRVDWKGGKPLHRLAAVSLS